MTWAHHTCVALGKRLPFRASACFSVKSSYCVFTESSPKRRKQCEYLLVSNQKTEPVHVSKGPCSSPGQMWSHHWYGHHGWGAMDIYTVVVTGSSSDQRERLNCSALPNGKAGTMCEARWKEHWPWKEALRLKSQLYYF